MIRCPGNQFNEPTEIEQVASLLINNPFSSLDWIESGFSARYCGPLKHITQIWTRKKKEKHLSWIEKVQKRFLLLAASEVHWDFSSCLWRVCVWGLKYVSKDGRDECNHKRKVWQRPSAWCNTWCKFQHTMRMGTLTFEPWKAEIQRQRTEQTDGSAVFWPLQSNIMCCL